MKKYFVEFIGTFFFVLTVAMVIGQTQSPVLGALAIGSALMVMVYAGGHISGGHYNPAVTLGVWLRGRCATKDVLPYWLAQFGAALCAAIIAGVMLETPQLLQCCAASPKEAAFVPAVVAEFLGTFALAWVVLNSATAKANAGNSFYGLAIGITVFVCAVGMGSISGGAFNPAIGLGIYLMGAATVKTLGIYLVADLLGGAAAALAFKVCSSEED